VAVSTDPQPSQLAVDLQLSPEQDARLEALFEADTRECVRLAAEARQARRQTSFRDLMRDNRRTDEPTCREVDMLENELRGLDPEDPRTVERLSADALSVLRRLAASVGAQPGSTVHTYPASDAQRLARTAGVSPAEAAQQLSSVMSPETGMWCFHPYAVCRSYWDAEACHSVVRANCPECGTEQVAVDAYPVLPAALMPPSVLRDQDAAAYSVGRWAPQHAQQDGLGTLGRRVPDHRPQSWGSGRPWDPEPSPGRDPAPERPSPGDTAAQRLAAAADRARKGVW